MVDPEDIPGAVICSGPPPDSGSVKIGVVDVLRLLVGASGDEATRERVKDAFERVGLVANAYGDELERFRHGLSEEPPACPAEAEDPELFELGLLLAPSIEHVRAAGGFTKILNKHFPGVPREIASAPDLTDAILERFRNAPAA